MKNGTRVNVTKGNEILVGVVAKTFKNGSLSVVLDDSDGKPNTFPASDVSERKAGRKSLAQTMSPAEMAKEVKGLIGELEGAKTIDDKKRLRRLLRRRGHAGGLGIRNAAE